MYSSRAFVSLLWALLASGSSPTPSSLSLLTPSDHSEPGCALGDVTSDARPSSLVREASDHSSHDVDLLQDGRLLSKRGVKERKVKDDPRPSEPKTETKMPESKLPRVYAEYRSKMAQQKKGKGKGQSRRVQVEGPMRGKSYEFCKRIKGQAPPLGAGKGPKLSPEQEKRSAAMSKDVSAMCSIMDYLTAELKCMKEKRAKDMLTMRELGRVCFFVRRWALEAAARLKAADDHKLKDFGSNADARSYAHQPPHQLFIKKPAREVPKSYDAEFLRSMPQDTKRDALIYLPPRTRKFPLKVNGLPPLLRRPWMAYGDVPTMQVVYQSRSRRVGEREFGYKRAELMSDAEDVVEQFRGLVAESKYPCPFDVTFSTKRIFWGKFYSDHVEDKPFLVGCFNECSSTEIFFGDLHLEQVPSLWFGKGEFWIDYSYG